MKTHRWTSLAAALALVSTVPCALAQDPAPSATPATPATPAPATPAPAAATPAGTPGAPNRDRMDQFRQWMHETMKTSLKATDEEWSVIEPLLEKVETKQREALVGRFAAFGGRRGGNRGGDRGGDRGARPGGDRPAPAVSPETEALKTALETEGTAPADIKAKLEALRASRKKAAAELDQAREDLRKVLTLRQEAALVTFGILE
ncbi:MAG: hypothetical protein PHQ12_10325 [Chthoniobacteraceae bacterium]|nr:hypothetical protein [Chthoniobacteraceae bacterium]